VGKGVLGTREVALAIASDVGLMHSAKNQTGVPSRGKTDISILSERLSICPQTTLSRRSANGPISGRHRLISFGP